MPTFLLVAIPVVPTFAQVPALPALTLRFVPSPKVSYISVKLAFTLTAPDARAVSYTHLTLPTNREV